MPTPPSLAQIFLAALRLGCTSFGGPVAHLAYFRREYVERRGWISADAYAEIVALCQFLPGPASSQTGFALGYRWRGWSGGVAAWLGFTLPSAGLMIGFALGLAQLGDLSSAGWLHGLKLAAAAVVAHAVIALWRAHATDWERTLLALLAAGLIVLVPHPFIQVGAIALGAFLGLRRWSHPPGASAATPPPRHSLVGPGALLALVLVLLFAWPAVRHGTDNAWTALGHACYQAGALVFGGGHVVLPLLERELVGPGGLTADQFLAGYGAAQALPGPLFTFAGYLGAVQLGALGGVWALLWIFLPGLLLVPAALPVWERVRHHAGAQAALRGATAAVVGVLLAALIDPVATPALRDWPSGAVALGAFGLLQFTRTPSWAVVVLCAAAGTLLVTR